MKKYKIVALVGKAGAGKDACLHQICKVIPNQVNEIISSTTRPPRQYEKDGINYYFKTEKDFQEKMMNNQFLETSSFRGWYYGTEYSSLSFNKINIGVFNPEGMYSLWAAPQVEVSSFLIWASDKTRLLRQLNREKNPDCNEIVRRFQTDNKDFLQLQKSQDRFSIIKNDNNGLEIAEVCKPIVNYILNWSCS